VGAIKGKVVSLFQSTSSYAVSGVWQCEGHLAERGVVRCSLPRDVACFSCLMAYWLDPSLDIHVRVTVRTVLTLEILEYVINLVDLPVLARLSFVYYRVLLQ
jgi:hypothetical protein